MRWLRTVGHRCFRFLVEYRWTLLGLTVVAVGIISMVASIATWILLLEAAFSVVLIALEVFKNLRESQRTRFFRRSYESFDDAIASYADGDVRVLTFAAGTFVHYLRASASMRALDPNVALAPRAYTVPPELQPHSKRFLKHVLRNPALFGKRFNGPCLGWNTNFEDDAWTSGDIEVMQARHFDMIQSDLLAAYDVEIDEHRVLELGRSLFIDRHGALRNFRGSWLLNLIGASTIAVTTDGQLVQTEQTSSNQDSRDLLAPSGSGSAERQDFLGRDAVPISAFATAAATRELTEEVNLDAAMVGDTFFLGFGRWLQNAGRGELLCVTFLTVDSDTVNRRPVRTAERVYTRKARCVRFAAPVDRWDPANPGDMLPLDYRIRMSVPLGAALSMLAADTRDADSEIRRRLVGAGVR